MSHARHRSWTRPWRPRPGQSGRRSRPTRAGALLRAIPAGALALAAGCVSISGDDSPVLIQYVLDDRGIGTAPPAGLPRIERGLLVAPVQASGFDESTMLAYGRDAGSRAHYQFAGWTDRPARRIGWLVERRLAARGRFASVAQSTAGVRGELMLNLTLEHLYHDVSTSPGQARIAVVAELVQWRTRSLIARRSFERSAPAEHETAAAAFDATGRALAALLDDLSAWVETQAQRPAASSVPTAPAAPAASN
ncbi:MAG: membrane integrity-associated transporter subunit PqiC [Burkholderiaceae bacterium]|nr:membrane integrity-associated transporter subunit PqiC [Burkholderiaceae bacterium]